MRWDVAHYCTATGERPVQRFVTDLPEPARVEAVALLVRLTEHGNALRKPHTKNLLTGYSSCGGDGTESASSSRFGLAAVSCYLAAS